METIGKKMGDVVDLLGLSKAELAAAKAGTCFDGAIMDAPNLLD